MTYKITFTESDGSNGRKIAAVWTGYNSYSEARSALRDADAIIPMFWEYEIEEA